MLVCCCWLFSVGLSVCVNRVLFSVKLLCLMLLCLVGLLFLLLGCRLRVSGWS